MILQVVFDYKVHFVFFLKNKAMCLDVNKNHIRYEYFPGINFFFIQETCYNAGKASLLEQNVEEIISRKSGTS